MNKYLTTLQICYYKAYISCQICNFVNKTLQICKVFTIFWLTTLQIYIGIYIIFGHLGYFL